MLKIIKTQLEGVKRAWPEEPPNILWAYRTTKRVPTGEMPFRLTFGTKAVIQWKWDRRAFESKLMKVKRTSRSLTAT